MTLDELRHLDIDTIAQWSAPARACIGGGVMVITLAILAFLFWLTPIERWQQSQQQEQQLRQQFEAKYRLAGQLEAQQQHLEGQQHQIGQLLQMLPSKNQLPRLLDDITFQATKNQLQITRVGWLAADRREGYVRHPLQLQLRGDFVDFGHFLDGVAKLPRIVSIDQLEIAAEQEALKFSVTASSFQLVGEGGKS